jgi:uric acid transporter
LTGVKSRFVVASAGVIMILLGLFPKVAVANLRLQDIVEAPIVG